MSRLLAQSPAESTSTESSIAFQRTGGEHWKEWDRFLVLDGKPAYHIGNICNTCAFFFERLGGANRSVAVDELERAFTDGVSSLTSELTSTLVQVLPSGKYRACLVSGRPAVVTPSGSNDYFCQEQVALHGVDTFWGLPHAPRTEYYRFGQVDLSPQRTLFEFVVPMFPHGWLKPEVIARYEGAFARGGRPTAFAISILDVKGPAEQESEHACLTHYLLDGHHKMWTAAQTGSEISLVSFLALDQGISSDEDLTAVLAALATTYR
jgi:hypothetical protein